MHQVGSRVAVLLILTLLANAAPSFARQPIRFAASPAAAAHNHTDGFTKATVVVPTPSQFVDPPAFIRHSPIKVAIGTGIIAGALYLVMRLFTI